MSTPERRHHSYSPSTLTLFEACGLYGKRDGASEKAITGTKQHRVTETGQDDHTLSDEQLAHSAECMEFANRIKNEVLAANTDAECLDILEPYLPIDERKWMVAVYDATKDETVSAIEDCTTGGYADRLLVFPTLRLAILFDWKFGLWPVEDAENNLQGISYVLGVFKKYPQVDSVRIFFKLPQLEQVTEHTFHRAQEDELRLRVMTVVERAEFMARHVNFEDATPMVPACLFCSRIGRCHKIQERILKVGQKYHPIEFPESIDTTLLRDPANFEKGLRLAQVVSEWAKSYKSLGTQQVLLGRIPVPEGFKIAAFSEREIIDTEKFRAAALRYLTEEEFVQTLKPTLGAVEKLISAKAPRGSKDETVEEFGQVLLDTSAVQKTVPVPYLKAVPKKADKDKQKNI
jgi:hypothetical protein